MIAYPRLADVLQRPGVMMRERMNLRGNLERRARAIALGAGAILAMLVVPAAAEKPVLAHDGSGSTLAREAIRMCFDASKASETERVSMLERGLATAERALVADPDDAKAHFAVFCNLGRKLEEDGATLAGVANVQRLRESVDRAVTLEPTFVDALAGKGMFLVELPGLLGGDEDEGLRLLRRAVQLAPDHGQARLQLAKALKEHGDEQAALAEARIVLAKADGQTAREASALTAELGS